METKISVTLSRTYNSKFAKSLLEMNEISPSDIQFISYVVCYILFYFTFVYTQTLN